MFKVLSSAMMASWRCSDSIILASLDCALARLALVFIVENAMGWSERKENLLGEGRSLASLFSPPIQ